MSLPIIVSSARAWIAIFACRAEPLRALLPPPLEPVTLRGRRGAAMVGIFDFTETSIGPYTQAMIGFAVRHRPWFSPPIGAIWLERKVTDFGFWVHLLATSTEQSCSLQRQTWGHPSFLADVKVQTRAARMHATVTDSGVEVLQFEMKRPGAELPMHFPLRAYSQLQGEILRTEMPIDAIGREKSLFANARLTVARHERVESLRVLEIDAASPVEVRWYDSFRTRIDTAAARYKAK
jgi:hypothetical protein